MVSIGDFIKSEGVQLTDAVRGVQFRFEGRVYEDGAASGSCSSTAVPGEVFDATGWPFIGGSARVVGTEQLVFMPIAYVTLGSAGIAAQYYFRLPTSSLELAYPPERNGSGVEGALEAIEVLVWTTNFGGTQSRTLFKGTVHICDSAVGTA